MAQDVLSVAFRPPAGSPGHVELLPFADLRRTELPVRRRPHRPDFHVLAIPRSGHGHVRVDFEDVALHEGVLVWLRPGQVGQWLDVTDVEGDLVLFTPGAVGVGVGDDGTASSWRVDGADRRLTLTAADHLRAEYEAAPVGPILHDLLAALLRRATASRPAALGPPDSLVACFRRAIDDHLRRGLRVDVIAYAELLGYSVRTLDRAALAATGASAKTILDERTVLEARRLLAHTDLSAAACGRRLGFSDAANFSAFFARQVGSTPGAWRRTLLIT